MLQDVLSELLTVQHCIDEISRTLARNFDVLCKVHEKTRSPHSTVVEAVRGEPTLVEMAKPDIFDRTEHEPVSTEPVFTSNPDFLACEEFPPNIMGIELDVVAQCEPVPVPDIVHLPNPQPCSVVKYGDGEGGQHGTINYA